MTPGKFTWKDCEKFLLKKLTTQKIDEWKKFLKIIFNVASVQVNFLSLVLVLVSNLNNFSSDYIEKNGVDEMQEYLNRYGIELYPSYDHSKIDIKKLFEEEFDFVSKLFLKHHLFRCDNIRGNMEQVLCLELYPLTENLDNLALAFEEMLSNMYRIYLHPQTAPKFREDFRKISRRQSNFYNLQVRLKSSCVMRH